MIDVHHWENVYGESGFMDIPVSELEEGFGYSKTGSYQDTGNGKPLWSVK